MTKSQTAARERLLNSVDTGLAAQRDAVNAAQLQLQARGVVAGDRVCAQLPNNTDHIAQFLACWRIGAVWVPINTSYGADEVQHVLDDATPTLVLGSALTPRAPPAPRDHDDLALLMYTSGTTGKSKGCALSANNVVDAVASLMQAWEVSAHDTVVHALPLFHVHGLCVALCGALLSGARVTLLEKFSPAAVVRAIADGGTVFMGVPTMYRRLLEHLDNHPEHCAVLSRARLFCSGSAPLPVADFQAWFARTGHHIVERYGMSETLITLSNPLHGTRKAGTVGLPLAGVEVRIVDDELWVRGPGVMRGYWHNADATRAVFDPPAQRDTEARDTEAPGDHDRWLKTGDAARIDADGYLTILGRIGVDFAKVGGFKVSLVEVEQALSVHPRVAEVAVVGVPDSVWGERLVACVVVTGAPMTLAELTAGLTLASHKHPREVVVVDALPKTALGKVQKKRLAQQLAQQLAGGRA